MHDPTNNKISKSPNRPYPIGVDTRPFVGFIRVNEYFVHLQGYFWFLEFYMLYLFFQFDFGCRQLGMVVSIFKRGFLALVLDNNGGSGFIFGANFCVNYVCAS